MKITSSKMAQRLSSVARATPVLPSRRFAVRMQAKAESVAEVRIVIRDSGSGQGWSFAYSTSFSFGIVYYYIIGMHIQSCFQIGLTILS